VRREEGAATCGGGGGSIDNTQPGNPNKTLLKRVPYGITQVRGRLQGGTEC
jgi:hypothetical protein